MISSYLPPNTRKQASSYHTLTSKTNFDTLRWSYVHLLFYYGTKYRQMFTFLILLQKLVSVMES